MRPVEPGGEWAPLVLVLVLVLVIEPRYCRPCRYYRDYGEGKRLLTPRRRIGRGAAGAFDGVLLDDLEATPEGASKPAS